MNDLKPKGKSSRGIGLSMALALGILATPVFSETECTNRTVAGEWTGVFGSRGSCELTLRPNGRINGTCADFSAAQQNDFTIRGSYSISDQCDMRFQIRYIIRSLSVRVPASYNGPVLSTTGASPYVALLVGERTTAEGSSIANFLHIYKTR